MADSTPVKVCCPPPPIASADKGIGQNFPVFGKQIFRVGTRIRYGFLNGANSNRAKAVQAAMREWRKYANIDFQLTNDFKNSDMRFSFLEKGSWSYIGTDAMSIKDPTQPTINLGWLEDKYPANKDDDGTIKHELGHALGMLHEHQSPAMGEKITLKEKAVYNYFLPLLGNDPAQVKLNVIDQYNLNDVSNFSALDPDSIMMYFMPGFLNDQNLDIPVNTDLSPLDKAYMTLTYPRSDEDAIKDGAMKVVDALNIVGVPADIAAKILAILAQNDLDGVRAAFVDWSLGVQKLKNANKNFVLTVNPAAGGQFGIRDSIAKVINDPMFKAILKNVVNGVFNARSIPTANAIPGAAQNDVLDTIGAFATNPTFAQSIADLNTFFSGVAPVSSHGTV